MLQLCRTCHCETTAHNCIAINDNNETSARIKSQLLSCVPELQQDLVKQPVLCSTCVEALNLAYAFKAQCLQTEGRIRNYFQNTTLSANNVTLLELYKEFSVKLEDSAIKLSNTVAYSDPGELGDAKDFVVDEVPILKEEVYDLNKEGINDLKNISASEDNEIKSEVIVKEDCDITQFKVDEDNFKKDSSDNELEKLNGNTEVEDDIQDIQTSEIELKELCLLDKALENTQKQISCVRIEDLRTSKLESSTKSNPKSDSSENRYCCSKCTYTTTKRTLLVNHMRNHGDKYVQCNVCEFRTSKATYLTTHMRVHTGEKPFQCDFCEFRSARNSHLKIHTRIHTGEKPFQCTICKFSSAYRKSLTEHTRIHTGEKPFQCSICEFRTSQRAHLGKHIKTHTGEKPFQCTICEFRAGRKVHLQSHMKSHSDEKPFHCTICEFRSAYRKCLNVHMRTHTGEKPFHCTVCEFRAARRTNLNQHMRTHSDAKPT